jgi:hypothetical protein
MTQNLEEILVSQEKMLRRRNAAAVPREQMLEAYPLHIESLFQWLLQRSDLAVLTTNYNEPLNDPRRHAEKTRQFLDGRPAAEAMVRAVASDLYRNRTATSQR